MKAVCGRRSGLLMAILIAASIMSVIPRLRGGDLHSTCTTAHLRRNSALSFMCEVSSDGNPAAKLDQAKAHREPALADVVSILHIPASQRIRGPEFPAAPFQHFSLHLRISPARSESQDPFI